MLSRPSQVIKITEILTNLLWFEVPTDKAWKWHTKTACEIKKTLKHGLSLVLSTRFFFQIFSQISFTKIWRTLNRHITIVTAFGRVNWPGKYLYFSVVFPHLRWFSPIETRSWICNDFHLPILRGGYIYIFLLNMKIVPPSPLKKHNYLFLIKYSERRDVSGLYINVGQVPSSLYLASS